MKSKTIRSEKSKEFTISVTELSRFWRSVTVKALRVIDAVKKGKIIIRLEKQ